MKNAYEVRGDVTVIFLPRKIGPPAECLIDTADLPLVRSMPNTWFLTTEGYVCGTIRHPSGLPRKRKYILLHRFLFNFPEDHQIDHKHFIGTDNRRSELRVLTPTQNMLNRQGPCRNKHEGGVRGVFWHQKLKKWVAKIQFKGRVHHLGVFTDEHEAGRLVEETAARLIAGGQI